MPWYKISYTIESPTRTEHNETFQLADNESDAERKFLADIKPCLEDIETVCVDSIEEE